MKQNRKGKREGKEKGQSLTEVALVLPIALLILAGVIDLGRLYYVTVALTDAAGEGAAYAAINPSDIEGAKARAQAASGGLVQIEADEVGVICPGDCADIAAGMPVTVTVGYDFAVATPVINAMVPGGVIRLRGIASESVLTGGM
jgi:Flp pilus assembly protein TadG